MTLKEFEELVAKALDDLPQEFARTMDNVDIVVEIWPTQEELTAGGARAGTTLFGLYRGIPKTKRGNYFGAIPDKIIIFAGPIVAHFGHDPQILTREVRNTVLHEIAHHFGLDDKEIINATSSRTSK